ISIHTFQLQSRSPPNDSIIIQKKNSSIEMQNKNKTNPNQNQIQSFIHPFIHSKSNSKVHRIIKIHRIPEIDENHQKQGYPPRYPKTHFLPIFKHFDTHRKN